TTIAESCGDVASNGGLGLLCRGACSAGDAVHCVSASPSRALISCAQGLSRVNFQRAPRRRMPCEQTDRCPIVVRAVSTTRAVAGSANLDVRARVRPSYRRRHLIPDNRPSSKDTMDPGSKKLFPTGIPGFDTLLGGGIPQRQLVT